MSLCPLSDDKIRRGLRRPVEGSIAPPLTVHTTPNTEACGAAVRRSSQTLTAETLVIVQLCCVTRLCVVSTAGWRLFTLFSLWPRNHQLLIIRKCFCLPLFVGWWARLSESWWSPIMFRYDSCICNAKSSFKLQLKLLHTESDWLLTFSQNIIWCPYWSLPHTGGERWDVWLTTALLA